ncbi:MAG: hypothetical protein EOP04_03110 [Proteobacteria bacterium]|nr:MAG: hypothetical protein EOP04_03110 [Pseudomonadota bacterium]
MPESEQENVAENSYSPRYRRKIARLIAATQIPNEAIRNYGRAILDRARESITQQSPLEKATGTEVFSFDPSQIDEARSRTHAYLDDMQRLAMRGTERTEMSTILNQRTVSLSSRLTVLTLWVGLESRLNVLMTKRRESKGIRDHASRKSRKKLNFKRS